jgi:hypothetical protein
MRRSPPGSRKDGQIIDVVAVRDRQWSMRRCMRRALIVFAAVVTFLLSLDAQAELIWGANGHPLVSYPGTTINEQLDLLKDLGVTSYRVDVGEPDPSTLMRLSELVAQAKKRGIETLPVLVFAKDLGAKTEQSLYKIGYDRARAYASRFKNDIRVWELGNEQETWAMIRPCEPRDNGVIYDCSWGDSGGNDPLDYVKARYERLRGLLHGLVDGIHSVDPTLQAAVGSAGWWHYGVLTRLNQDGVKWDITVWHWYAGDPAKTNNTDALPYIAQLGHPIWITELNAPYTATNWEQLQASGLRTTLKWFVANASKYRIEAIHVYELLDEPYWAPTLEAYLGLVHVNKNAQGRWILGDPKPAYFAVKSTIGVQSR